MRTEGLTTFSLERGDTMIKSKLALISSVIILGICMYLYFPFPNNEILGARSTFMSFPIRNQKGYILLGIIGSVQWDEEISPSNNNNSCNSIWTFTKSSNYDVPRNVSKWHYSNFIRW